jgi:hypothetical protein
MRRAVERPLQDPPNIHLIGLHLQYLSGHALEEFTPLLRAHLAATRQGLRNFCLGGIHRPLERLGLRRIGCRDPGQNAKQDGRQ